MTVLYKVYKGKKLIITNLKVFECAVCSHVSKDKFLKTFKPRITNNYIFVRFRGNRIWKLLYYKTLKELYTADTRFNKYRFLDIVLPNNIYFLVKVMSQPLREQT